MHPRLDDEAMMNDTQRTFFCSRALQRALAIHPLNPWRQDVRFVFRPPGAQRAHAQGTCLQAGDLDAWSIALAEHHTAWTLSQHHVADERLMEHAKRFSSEAFVENMAAALFAVSGVEDSTTDSY